MFGGTTVAQLLAAAQRSCSPDLQASNLSVNFLAPANGAIPCEYHVANAHDGRSSATRSITVTQHDALLAIGTVALHTPRATWSHQHKGRHSAHPETLPRTGMPHPARAIPEGHFDIRYTDKRRDGAFVRALWFRCTRALPDETWVHQCVISLISDLYFFEPIVAELGLRADARTVRYGTTQHAMWFHRQARADEWLVIESTSPVGVGGRGLVTGQVRTVDGSVVATVVQEVAIRLDLAVKGTGGSAGAIRPDPRSNTST